VARASAGGRDDSWWGGFFPSIRRTSRYRLISLRQFLDPSFPGPDWLQAAGYDEDRLTIGFKATPVSFVALHRQSHSWLSPGGSSLALLLYSLVRLAHAMEVRPFPLACGLCFCSRRADPGGGANGFSTAWKANACAYAISCSPSKPPCRQRVVLCAFLCGTAWWFHVPVAVWGTSGLPALCF